MYVVDPNQGFSAGTAAGTQLQGANDPKHSHGGVGGANICMTVRTTDVCGCGNSGDSRARGSALAGGGGGDGGYGGGGSGPQM